MNKAQLTIRGFDDELALRLRRLAEERDISLNKAALVLMRRGAGLGSSGDQANVIGNSLDQFMGVWTEEDAAELQEAMRDFDRIDEDLWT